MARLSPRPFRGCLRRRARVQAASRSPMQGAYPTGGRNMAAPKTNPGHYFEDFRLGQVLRHATPRTVTTGDVALYTALTGSRFAVQSSDVFAQGLGYPRSPVDDLLTFHIVFGKTVP